jgi:hypothetical protein
MKRSVVLAMVLLCAPWAVRAEMALPVLYTLHCSGCHGAAGHGVPRAGIPDLAYAGSYLAVPQGRAYLAQVPGVSQSRLSDTMAAAMLNYVLGRFSVPPLRPDFPRYTAAELGVLRAHAASDAETRRGAILADLRLAGVAVPPY